MKKYLILFLALSLPAFANEGLVNIKLESAINVSVHAKAKNITINKTAIGYNIDRALVLTNELTTSPSMVKSSLKSERLLDTAKYKEIIVSNLICVENNKIESSGACTADLEIKGIKHKIENMTYLKLNSNLQLKFNFKLSDYNIAQKVFLFRVQNQAAVDVTINL
jgi:hypothetical protein